MKQGEAKKKHNLTVIGINLLCVILIIALFLGYNYENQSKLYSQNLNDITNLNRSAATVSESYFSYQDKKLRDAAYYISEMNFTFEEALDYIYSSNSDQDGTFEVIGGDAKGYLIKRDENGDYIPLNYSMDTYSELRMILRNVSEESEGKINYTPEFTDAYSAHKSFAFYTTIRVRDPEPSKRFYTLMYVSRSTEFVDLIQQEGGYAEFSTALIDSNGNYIIGDSAFKSSNFYQYLYVFNDLTLDQRKAIEQEVERKQSGVLTYKDSGERDCVYVYYKIPMEQWYCVSCVPLASFHNAEQDNRFTFIVVFILSAMLVIDIVWLNNLNRKLKMSMVLEREANAAKTDFLSRMSHDMRTPLNAVLGFIAIARSSPNMTPDIEDSIEKIDYSGRYLLGLINDILDMSKIESGKIELHEEPIELLPFLRGVAEIFKSEASQKDITLITDFSTELAPVVVMDQLRIRQIFSNLLSNAVKFSDNDTQIEWTVRDELDGRGNTKLTSVVRDHGCGMSQKFLHKMFEPFEQEDNKYTTTVKGTGLGLSIVKELIDLMGGTINVESEIGKGTTFTITLVRKLAESTATESFEDSETLVPDEILPGKRILLCEDHPLNRQIAVRLLEMKGAIVEGYENGWLGVDAFERSAAGYYDAIMMDIRMPVMNGLDATRAIRSLDRADAARIPIIAMTANAYDEDVKTSISAGMNAHLAKPVEPLKLYETLARYIRQNEKQE